MATRLKEHYDKSIVKPKLIQEEFGYTNPMQVPRLEKIVINMGVGEACPTPRSRPGRGRGHDG